MKLIYLGGKYGSIVGNYAQVDDKDYEYLIQWKWYASNLYKGITYARRTINRNKKQSMHRDILNNIESPCIDHIDGNGLNNQRNNLRPATPSQNMANRIIKTNKSSSYIGVSVSTSKKRNKEYKYWVAECKKDGKNYRKWCKTEIQAALQYNEWAKELHGEYANLNIIED